MDRLDKPTVLEANILYAILGVILLFLGSFVQNRELYTGLLITEIIIVLIPNILFLKSKGINIKASLRLNKINKKQVLYIFLIALFSYPIAIFLNLIISTLISFMGDTVGGGVPIPDSPLIYYMSLFVIGLVPGICEEVMFRGTILRAYERFGRKNAIFISAILFGVFHMNILNLMGPIFLGIIFGILVEKTNSIYSSMLAHTLNNTLALTIGYLATKGGALLENMEDTPDPTAFELGIILVIVFTFAYISYFVLMKLLRDIPGGQEDQVDQVEEVQDKPVGLKDFTPIVFVLVLFVIINAAYVFL